MQVLLGGVHHWRHGADTAFASTSTKSDRSALSGAVCAALLSAWGCLLRVSAARQCTGLGLGLAETCGPLTALGLHRRCIDRWLRTDVHCPLCKTPERTPQNSALTVRIGACTA